MLDIPVTCAIEHIRKNLQGNVLSASSKVKLFTNLAYGPTLWGDNVQWNILSTSAKARIFAQPDIWPYTLGRQPAMKHSKDLSQGQAISPEWHMAVPYKETTCKEAS